MAKITIEIDGSSALLKIDGKEVKELSSFSADFYRYEDRSNKRTYDDIFFSYSVKDSDNGEFPSQTTYHYLPSKASFDSGKTGVDTKNPTRSDYGRM